MLVRISVAGYSNEASAVLIAYSDTTLCHFRRICSGSCVCALRPCPLEQHPTCIDYNTLTGCRCSHGLRNESRHSGCPGIDLFLPEEHLRVRSQNNPVRAWCQADLNMGLCTWYHFLNRHATECVVLLKPGDTFYHVAQMSSCGRHSTTGYDEDWRRNRMTCVDGRAITSACTRNFKLRMGSQGCDIPFFAVRQSRNRNSQNVL